MKTQWSTEEPLSIPKTILACVAGVAVTFALIAGVGRGVDALVNGNDDECFDIAIEAMVLQGKVNDIDPTDLGSIRELSEYSTELGRLQARHEAAKCESAS